MLLSVFQGALLARGDRLSVFLRIGLTHGLIYSVAGLILIPIYGFGGFLISQAIGFSVSLIVAAYVWKGLMVASPRVLALGLGTLALLTLTIIDTHVDPQLSTRLLACLLVVAVLCTTIITCVLTLAERQQLRAFLRMTLLRFSNGQN